MPRGFIEARKGRFIIMRAGREPAEDVVRTLKRACQDAGLIVKRTMARLTEDREARTILVSASPPNWPHSTPMVSLMTSVKISGDVAGIRLQCRGTDEDPLVSVFTAPVLRGCEAPLQEVADTLENILLDRVHVGRLLAEGRTPPFITGDWTWAIPSLD